MSTIVNQSNEFILDDQELTFINSTLYKYMSKVDQLKALQKLS